MRQQPKVEAGAKRQEAAGKVERDAVNGNAQELSQANIHTRHQRQRRQEVLAELAIGVPGFAFPVNLKGKRVNQNRLAVNKLDVVRAGILKRHAHFERALLDGESRERGILPLAERPLVRVRDERHALGLDDFEGQRCVRGRDVRFGVRDQQSRLDQFAVQPRLH